MMTTDQRAELDAAVARFPVSLPWFACPTERDGVTGIHGEPHGEPPYQGVAYLADVFGDAAPVVAVMNAVPALTAHIDAQAERIAELEAENARLREAVGRLSVHNMFWDPDNAEVPLDNPFEGIDDDYYGRRFGYVHEVWTARRMKSIFVAALPPRCGSDSDDNWEVEGDSAAEVQSMLDAELQVRAALKDTAQ